MRVSILYTPSIWNIGNDFINQGARYVLKDIFAEFPDVQVCEVELLETSNSGFKYPTTITSPADREILVKSDLIIMIGGSCLSRYYQRVFEEVKMYKAKKILVGASFYENISTELGIYRDLPKYFDQIFVRDEATYQALSQGGFYKNVTNGVDFSFYLPELLTEDQRPSKNKTYQIVNIDSPEIGELRNKCLVKCDNPYLMWNNPTKVGFSNVPQSQQVLIAENWKTYVRFIIGASHVYTNRVHTLAICYLFGIPCTSYLPSGSNFERHFIFRNVGFESKNETTYTKVDYEKSYEELEAKKSLTKSILRLAISTIRHEINNRDSDL